MPIATTATAPQSNHQHSSSSSSSMMNLVRGFVQTHRHSAMMIAYCSITGVGVWLSARHHQTFQQWISESDWSAFLLWHLQFHIWYLLYHALNHMLLGSLRPSERIKARKGQLAHFMHTLIFIIVVCGLDIFEGFCWLHWVTPFSFFRMSLVVISERLENPPPPTTTTTTTTTCIIPPPHSSHSDHPHPDGCRHPRVQSKHVASEESVTATHEKHEEDSCSTIHDDVPNEDVITTTSNARNVHAVVGSTTELLHHSSRESEGQQDKDGDARNMNSSHHPPDNNNNNNNENNHIEQHFNDDSSSMSENHNIDPSTTWDPTTRDPTSTTWDPNSTRKDPTSSSHEGEEASANVDTTTSTQQPSYHHSSSSFIVTTTENHMNNDMLIFYLLILILILCICCMCGTFVFHSLPFSSKLMIFYEPLVCCIQWTVVFSCVLICDSITPIGMPKDDLKFGIEWTGEFACQLISTFRYALVWLLFGHSLIFNVVDVLIFMKLKGCFSNLSTSVHNLRVFLAVRKILNRSLPNVYPKPNYPNIEHDERDHNTTHTTTSPTTETTTTEDNFKASANENTRVPLSQSSVDTVTNNIDTISSTTAADKRIDRRKGSNDDDEKKSKCCSSSDNPTVDSMSSGHPSSSVVEKGLLGRVAKFWSLFLRSFCGVASSSLSSSSSSSSQHRSHNLNSSSSNNVPSSSSSSSSQSPLLSPSYYATSMEDLYPICVVCRDPLIIAKQLPCGHILHQHCLRQWMDTDLTCPICRSPCLAPDDERILRSLLGRSSPNQQRDHTIPTQTTATTPTVNTPTVTAPSNPNSTQHSSALSSDNAVSSR